MINRPRMVAFAIAVMAASAAAQEPPKISGPALPPVEAFGNLPNIGGPSLSPDGKRLALIQARNGRPVATVWNLEATGTPPLVIPYEEGFIDQVRWANNQRLLVRVNLNARVWGDNVKPWHRTVSANADGTSPVVLFSNKKDARDINYSASVINDIAPNDPDHIYMPLYSGGAVIMGSYYEPTLTLFRVDVNNGHAEAMETGNKNTNEYITDGNGNLVARIDQTKNPLTDHLFAYTTDKNWKEIVTTDATAGGGLDVAGLSIDSKSLVMSVRNDKTNTGGLVNMSLADGTVSELYFEPLYDVSSSLIDPWTSRVIGASYISHIEHDTYFDPKFQDLQKRLEGYFPGQSVHALAWDLNATKLVVSVDSATSPPTFYLFTAQTNTISRLGRTYGGLKPSDLGEVRVYDYKARDGLQIPAYLTVPPGKDAKNLPVVILPHGGPMARDNMNFDWESQFLANRGYAVLQPNFRGSSGYGTKFEEAGYGQWGLKMQDDITDGVKKLIADGIADPKRICIVGGSYGGYAALAGAAFTPDLYACAAAWAPVTDLRQFLRTRSNDFGRDSWMISSWSHFIGDRWNDSEKLDAASPVENATKIQVPVLLMHGEADATVRIDQSEDMERALRKAKKKVTFIRIPKETHYMETADTRIRWLTELEKFLKENIGN